MLTESNKNNNIKNKCPFPLLKRTNITDPLNYSHMIHHSFFHDDKYGKDYNHVDLVSQKN